MLKSLLYALKRPFHLVKTGLLEGLPAEIRYRFPARKLTIIGITGTDGKTTSSTMLYHVLKAAGKKVGLISTVAAFLGEQEIDTGFHVTTPGPGQIHQLLRQMVDQGYEYLVLETTSHGLYQYRTWGINPQYVGVTNIAREHLDYHLTYDNYVAAKALLLKNARVAVLNADDDSYSKLKKYLKNRWTEVVPFSASDRLNPALFRAIKARFPESYNQMNARLVSALAQQLNLAPKGIAEALQTFPGVPGRMQVIPNSRRLHIVVDFAHTPQGLESILTALRQRLKATAKAGQLIAIYGCAGLRDVGKRPLMGELGGRLADVALFTAEDPRTENVWSIIDQMKSELQKTHAKVLSIADRKTAIAFALQKIAKPGDTIAILGKGHEKSMCFGTTEYPWSDEGAVIELLQTPLSSI